MPGTDRPWNDARGGTDRSPDAAGGDGGSDDRNVVFAVTRRHLAALAGSGAVAGVAVVACVVLFLAVSSIGCGCQPVGPQVAFDEEYRPGSDSLVLTHAGGDVLGPENTGRLDVTVNGERTATVGVPLEAGDSFAVEDVDPGDEVRIVWHHPDQEDGTARVIWEYTVPGAGE